MFLFRWWETHWGRTGIWKWCLESLHEAVNLVKKIIPEIYFSSFTVAKCSNIVANNVSWKFYGIFRPFQVLLVSATDWKKWSFRAKCLLTTVCSTAVANSSKVASRRQIVSMWWILHLLSLLCNIYRIVLCKKVRKSTNL